MEYTYTFNDGAMIEVEQDDGQGYASGTTVWDACLVASKYIETHAAKLARGGFGGKGTRPDNNSDSTTNNKSNTNNITVRVLELGSGTGLFGLVTARSLGSAGFSCSVLLTDTPKVAAFTSLNVTKNINAIASFNTSNKNSSQILNSTMKTASSSSSETTVKKNPLDASSQNFGTSTLISISTAGLTWTASLPIYDAKATEWLAIAPPDIVLLSDCVYEESSFAQLITTLRAVCANDTLVVLAYERRNFDAEVNFFKEFGQFFRFKAVPEEDQDPLYKSVDDIYLFLAKKRVDTQDF
ncbi:Methyltransferase-like protein 21D [Physocladia obscura]|uniref:Methyltransferase-like protein 21D n=1 Tax=Physocladia obscura TaxID=109957 RepID=A0AAD5TAX2_9FUNG|nr:Methyltransferase-like protein 21D [Physocladia obscura]